MPPLVSIVIPTKNSARFIERCLRSINDQTYGNIETIVADDHSADETRAVAARYGARVLVLGPERSTQRNEGARAAYGQYIIMIDSDMRLTPRVVASCVDAMGVDPGIVGLIIPEESVGEGFWAECKRLERSFYVGVSWMEGARFFRRDDFLAVGGYDEALVSGEDWDLSQHLASRGRLSRVNEFILHDEGHLKLGRTLRKKCYYAVQFSRYAAKREHVRYVASQTNVWKRYALFFSRPKELFRHPLIGLGMLFMKTCEFAAGAMAVFWARIRRIENLTSPDAK